MTKNTAQNAPGGSRESEQVRETGGGASDKDYSWYFNRSVIEPEDFDRALEVEKDIEQEKVHYHVK